MQDKVFGVKSEGTGKGNLSTLEWQRWTWSYHLRNLRDANYIVESNSEECEEDDEPEKKLSLT